MCPDCPLLNKLTINNGEAFSNQSTQYSEKELSEPQMGVEWVSTKCGPINLGPLLDPFLEHYLDPLFFLPENMGS